MERSPAPPLVWQYALVWTPGPEHSSAQLWAISSAGRRTLWDSWEAPGFPETPSLHAVLHALYYCAVDAQERSTSTR
jgi:hypothetical protein